MEKLCAVILLAIVFLCFCPFTHAYDKSLTIHVDAGKQDCFYQHAKVGDIIDIEYQVIDGGHGDLDISFELAEPIGRIIFADYKKSENVHQHEVRIEGDYRFCFDNRFSSFNRKTITIELIVEGPDDGEQSNENYLEGMTPEEFYEIKVQDIMEYITRIRDQITKARQIQTMLRSYEARDRNSAEENFFKVNAWSAFQIFAMLGVGALQVFMVRSIFETNSKLHKIWDKLNL